MLYSIRLIFWSLYCKTDWSSTTGGFLFTLHSFLFLVVFSYYVKKNLFFPKKKHISLRMRSLLHASFLCRYVYRKWKMSFSHDNKKFLNQHQLRGRVPLLSVQRGASTSCQITEYKHTCMCSSRTSCICHRPLASTEHATWMSGYSKYSTTLLKLLNEWNEVQMTEQRHDNNRKHCPWFKHNL